MDANPQDDTSSEDEIVDDDTCEPVQIAQLFSNNYIIQSEESLSLKKIYVLHLANSISFNSIAAGTSNGTVQIFDVSSRKLDRKLIEDNIGYKNTALCGVKFLQDNENLLLVGSSEGIIDLYDLRSNQKEASFEDNSDNSRKPISCFDINTNNRVICAGTEQILSDAFLLFFDIRQKTLLGGYVESHHDDVTAVKFHETNPDLMCTGSTDGLINIFDISQSAEDDALQTVINTESSVHKLNWHKDLTQKDVISCITHTNDLKVFDANGDVFAEFSRNEVTNAMRRKSVNDCVLVNCHNLEDGTINLLAASNFQKGETVRLLKLTGKQLIPYANFEDNKQIIRESIYDAKNDMLITAGEGGIITLWSNKEHCKLPNMTSLFKSKSKINKKMHNKKPY